MTDSSCICLCLNTQFIKWKLLGTNLLLHDNSILHQLSILSKANCHHSSSELQTLTIVVLHCMRLVSEIMTLSVYLS